MDQSQGNRSGGIREEDALRGFGHTPVEQVQAQVADGLFLHIVEGSVKGFAAQRLGVQREGDLCLAGLIVWRGILRAAQAAA